MRGLAIGLLLLAAAACLGSCQMFQYSRGWRPGKRAEASLQHDSPVSAPDGSNVELAVSPMFGFLVRCLQAINAWEALHAARAADAPELGRVASHLLDVLEHCQIKEGYWLA